MKVIVERHKYVNIYRLDCHYCGSTLEYVDDDIYPNGDYRWVKCPVCDSCNIHRNGNQVFKNEDNDENN